MKKPTKPIIDLIFDTIFGDDDETDSAKEVDAAIARDERVAKKGALPMRRADYTVDVVYDVASGLFNAVLRTKTTDIAVDAEGSTPGEALAYAGMLIDASLARRGFMREQKQRKKKEK